MPFRWDVKEHAHLAAELAKWLLIAGPLGAVVGSAVALFLWSLDRVTTARFDHPWLLYLLPVAGLAIGLVYHWLGQSVEAGNNLIVDQIHEPGGGVPARMAPLVLIGTLVTHLFGGSAGREGTAVQMGGSLASTLGRPLRLGKHDTRVLLMAGVAAGFGAVFGTPLTGAVFALEVLAIGKLSYEPLIACLIASVAGDWTTTAWGIRHTPYSIGAIGGAAPDMAANGLDALLLAKVGLAAIAFGLTSVLFAELAHSFGRIFKRLIPWAPLRPAIGGAIVIGLVYLVGTRDYLGLGVSAPPDNPGAVTIASCFHNGGATDWSWFWKIIFTTVTVSSGFKGGEVTPLFFIGAALGNTLGRWLGAPVDLLAGLGFVAVFAGATNTPLACTIMGIELFSRGAAGLFESGFVVYLATACFVAYLMSGHSGIYLSQRVGAGKGSAAKVAGDASLRSVREQRPSLAGRLLDRPNRRRGRKRNG